MTPVQLLLYADVRGLDSDNREDKVFRLLYRFVDQCLGSYADEPRSADRHSLDVWLHQLQARREHPQNYRGQPLAPEVELGYRMDGRCYTVSVRWKHNEQWGTIEGRFALGYRADPGALLSISGHPEALSLVKGLDTWYFGRVQIDPVLWTLDENPTDKSQFKRLDEYLG